MKSSLNHIQTKIDSSVIILKACLVEIILYNYALMLYDNCLSGLQTVYESSNCF